LFAYFGGTFGPIGVDFGLGYHFPGLDKVKNPIGVGVNAKYETDQFGAKLRVAATLAGDDKATTVLVGVLPYFNINDNVRAYLDVAFSMYMPDGGDSDSAFYINPWIEIGSYWGSKFLAGVKATKFGKEGDLGWAVPIALVVSF